MSSGAEADATAICQPAAPPPPPAQDTLKVTPPFDPANLSRKSGEYERPVADSLKSRLEMFSKANNDNSLTVPKLGYRSASTSSTRSAKLSAALASGPFANPTSTEVSYDQPVTPDGTPSRPSVFTPSSGSKCVTCSKTVYVMEQILYDDKVFHKACLKCKHCGSALSLKNVACLDGVYYCKPHFKQLFKLKGNYAEGFGKVDPKKNWTESPSASAS
ncbi:hypothetical protein DFJ73DRAFT_228773 [Zopfochytrium polystomum]|nr:hypothetical protein DFJ73DRAFT_228773 [Zopfochytrium polystomum]